eukprot:1719488-Amphidinium_carterae.3
MRKDCKENRSQGTTNAKSMTFRLDCFQHVGPAPVDPDVDYRKPLCAALIMDDHNAGYEVGDDNVKAVIKHKSRQQVETTPSAASAAAVTSAFSEIPTKIDVMSMMSTPDSSLPTPVPAA